MNCTGKLPVRRTSTAGGQSGSGIVEVVIASIVVAVAVLGAVTAMLSSIGLTRVNHDTAIARQAARQQLEEIQGVPFAEIFAVFNDSAVDDGTVTSLAVGANFDVPGLTPQANDLDGMCGSISFPVAAGGAADELLEDVVDPVLGMPRDLDMNGTIDAVDKSGDYLLLPVRVRVQWRGASGNQSIDLETVLSQR